MINFLINQNFSFNSKLSIILHQFLKEYPVSRDLESFNFLLYFINYLIEIFQIIIFWKNL